MSPPKLGSAACHNCRRRRLKCDRSLPHCRKCTKRGQECLGYESLLRWEMGVASRGKMAGLRFDQVEKPQVLIQPLLIKSPADPLLQDLNPISREYLLYFGSSVCRDLVLYDLPKHNPFRELIPLTHQHPTLLQIIIANSALHMSNASQKSLTHAPMGLPSPPSSLLSSPSPQPCTSEDSYVHALVAKQRALSMLQNAIDENSPVNVDATLATVLLFIEFELLDSGRDDWRHHTRGARAIIESLCGPHLKPEETLSPLRSCLISNCLVFDILGCTLTGPTTAASDDLYAKRAMSLLHDDEGNHCSSFPVALLQLLRTAAQLFESRDRKHYETKQHAICLLHSALVFNPSAWALNLQTRSPAADLEHRTHVASAHRAAVCIYLSRVLLSVCPKFQLAHDLEIWVAEIIKYLSTIQRHDALFTATAWPTFVAGAETSDRSNQTWVKNRFEGLWQVEPWGLIRGSLGVLERIWESKQATERPKKDHANWVRDLKTSGVDWLIA